MNANNFFSMFSLALTLSLGAGACANGGGVVQTPDESPTLTAMGALGQATTLRAMSAADTDSFVRQAGIVQATVDELNRLKDDQFKLVTAPVALWTEGNGQKLGIVLQRVERNGERVMVSTLIRPDLSPVSTLTFEGADANQVVTEFGPNGPQVIDLAQLHFAAPAATKKHLAAYSANTDSLGCTILNGMISSGAQVADGLCTGEAGFVCFWQYVVNTPGFNACIERTKHDCLIRPENWNQQVCL